MGRGKVKVIDIGLEECLKYEKIQFNGSIELGLSPNSKGLQMCCFFSFTILPNLLQNGLLLLYTPVNIQSLEFLTTTDYFDKIRK